MKFHLAKNNIVNAYDINELPYYEVKYLWDSLIKDIKERNKNARP